MCDKKPALCLDFENEVWLYKENELSSERMEFWLTHLSVCAECRAEMEEDILISELVKDKSLDVIDDASFERIIDKAVNKNKFAPQNLFLLLNYLKDNSGIYGKAAFASALAIIALVITLSTHKPTAVKNIPAEILDWNGAVLNQKIEEVKDRINFMSEDGWDKQIMQLDESLRRMEQESDEYSFNK